MEIIKVYIFTVTAVPVTFNQYDLSIWRPMFVLLSKGLADG